MHEWTNGWTGMFMGRFAVPSGARYRLYPNAHLDRDSEEIATETTKMPAALSVAELSSRLKNLCPLHVVRCLNACPGTSAASYRLELDFADYMAVCGQRQRCQCDYPPENVGDVSMGTCRSITTRRIGAGRIFFHGWPLRGSEGRKSPSRVQGQLPVGVWGSSPQKLTTFYQNDA